MLNIDKEPNGVISSIPSKAILQAVADVETIERLEHFQIGMSLWVNTEYVPEAICSVCMGGAILARAANYDLELLAEIDSPCSAEERGLISVDEYSAVTAMDEIRMSDPVHIYWGLWDRLRVPQKIAQEASELHNKWTVYAIDPERFKEERRELANFLKERGY